MGPRITIGVPVFNGANYLERALGSIESQTFADFRVIISDNASEDATEEIARSFVARDERFGYSRNDRNIGAIPNYDKVFYASTSEFFKWAAHDDWIEPGFVQACIERLDASPVAVVAYTGARQVDENDNQIVGTIAHSNVTSPDPVERFREIVRRERLNLPIFGVVRREVLARTNLQGSYHASARVLLAELALLGTFERDPEVLFVHRNHPQGSLRSYADAREVRKWYDTSATSKGHMPRWMYLRGLLAAAGIADLSAGQRWSVRMEALRWATTKPKAMLGDLVAAVRDRMSPEG